MREKKDIKQFTFILSIGSVFYLAGDLLFRFIGLFILKGDDYSEFSLALQTFQLILQIAGLQLHSPLTRELRLNDGSKDIKDVYAISYWFTSSIGFFLMLIFGIFFLTSFSIGQLILFSLSLILFALTEFFLAVVRFKGDAIKSALISGISGIIRALIVIPFIFNITGFLTLDGFLYLYCFSLFVSFLIGAVLSKPTWKSLFHSLKKIKYKEELFKAIKNLKKGFLLSIQGFFHHFGNWLIIFLAIKILDPNNFKIFDLCMRGITILWMFGANLTIATLSRAAINKKTSHKDNKMFYLIGLVFSGITIIGFFCLDLIPLDFILSEFLNLTLPSKGKNLIRTAIFVPLPIMLMSFFNGKIQALGKYKKMFYSSCVGFLVLILVLILGFFINSGEVLFIALILFNLLKALLFYWFIYH